MKVRQLIIIATGVVLLAGSFLISGFLSGQKTPPEIKKAPEIKRYVQTKAVEYSDIPTEILAFGRVKTAESLDLIAEVSGRMYRGNVSFKEGQRFTKGTLLYRIDDTEAKLNLQAQKSNFLRDLAAILPDIKIDYSNNYTNWQSYFESIDTEKPLPVMPEFKSLQEKTFMVTKNILGTYYTIKSAEANLAKHYYYAPFNGTLSEVNLQSGAFVNPGTKIGTALRSDKLEIKVDVNSEDIEWIEIGSKAVVRTETGKEWQARVVRIGDFINPATQSIDVFLAVENGSGRPFDGQYLEAKIPGKVVNNGMQIPRSAVYDGNEVFVLKDSLLKVKTVTLHKVNAETAIFSGLKEGEDLVTEPLVNAHNNMKAFKMDAVDQDINLERKEVATQLVTQE